MKPISKAACGSFGDAGHSPCRTNVTDSGSWQQNLNLTRCWRPIAGRNYSLFKIHLNANLQPHNAGNHSKGFWNVQQFISLQQQIADQHLELNNITTRAIIQL